MANHRSIQPDKFTSLDGAHFLESSHLNFPVQNPKFHLNFNRLLHTLNLQLTFLLQPSPVKFLHRFECEFES